MNRLTFCIDCWQVYPTKICRKPSGPNNGTDSCLAKIQLSQRRNALGLGIGYVRCISFKWWWDDTCLCQVGINAVLYLLREFIGKTDMGSCLIAQDKRVCFYVQQATQNHSTLAR